MSSSWLVIWMASFAINWCWAQQATCDEKSWPSTKQICADCVVLVDNFHEYRTCDNYCTKQGKQCVAAHNDRKKECLLWSTHACNETLDSSDAICECRPHLRALECADLGQHRCERCGFLLDSSGPEVRNCAAHCGNKGLTCLGAFKVEHDSCSKILSMDCDVTGENDVLCKCASTPSGFIGEHRWHTSADGLISNGAHEQRFERWAGTNCWETVGSEKDIDKDASAPEGLTVSECATRCSSWHSCEGFVYLKVPLTLSFGHFPVGKCWMRKGLKEKEDCHYDMRFDTYTVAASSSRSDIGFFDPSGLLFRIIVVVACILIAVAICLVLVRNRSRSHEYECDQTDSELSASDSGESGPFASELDLNLHYVVSPEKWCVDAAQLYDFGQAVEELFPGFDPDGYQVVEDFIKPHTAACRTSYALKLNAFGKQVTHFVTHAWAEGVKEFVQSVKSTCSDDAVFWICFLSNPQTWPSGELGALLGANPYLSPFFAAVRDCKTIIAVRNQRVNMCERLWCVFELFEASKMSKPIVAVGTNPDSIHLDRVGINATCSNDRDTKMLRKAIRLTGQEENINRYVAVVLERDAPGFL
eukprot:TRINITY_DN25256_c0_g1_i1.p1 TRINITY_DN25256_c0_g1~~TRINITY_DN25256_c0_g1_i1.p1  ORF type:complete len:588 (+),score=53.61 TRINITY_DN25256_c0_g1_i1:82-1845(+)